MKDYWEQKEYDKKQWWTELFDELCRFNLATQKIMVLLDGSLNISPASDAIESAFDDLVRTISSKFWHPWKPQPGPSEEYLKANNLAWFNGSESDAGRIYDYEKMSSRLNIDYPILVFYGWNGELVHTGNGHKHGTFERALKAFNLCMVIVERVLKSKVISGKIDIEAFRIKNPDDHIVDLDRMKGLIECAIEEILNLPWVEKYRQEKTLLLETNPPQLTVSEAGKSTDDLQVVGPVFSETSKPFPEETVSELENGKVQADDQVQEIESIAAKIETTPKGPPPEQIATLILEAKVFSFDNNPADVPSKVNRDRFWYLLQEAGYKGTSIQGVWNSGLNEKIRQSLGDEEKVPPKKKGINRIRAAIKRHREKIKRNQQVN